MNKRQHQAALDIARLRRRAHVLRMQIAQLDGEVQAIIQGLYPRDPAYAFHQDTVQKLWVEVAALKAWQEEQRGRMP